MKKLTAIGLILLFLASQAGISLYYAIQQNDWKEERQEALRSGTIAEELTEIILEDGTANLSWEENGREVRINGELYDVASVEMQNGKTHIIAIRDSREQQIENRKNESTGKNTGNKSSKHQLNPVGTEYTLPAESIQKGTALISVQYGNHPAAIALRALDILSPPPQA